MPPVLQHLDAVAAEVERARDVERRIGRDVDVRGLQRLVAPHRLVAREAAVHHQPPVRPLAHQAQLRLQRDARAVGADRGDVERGLGAGIHRVVGESRLDADQLAGRAAPGSRWLASEAWPDGSLTPAVIDAFSACVVSGARGSEIVSVDMALRVGVRQRQVLAVRRVGLVDQADAIAGQRRERRRIDQRAASAPCPVRPAAGAPYRKRAVTGSE